MQFDQFVEGRQPVSEVKHTGEFAEYLEQADAWTRAFADVLKQRFENPDAFVAPEAAKEWLDRYEDWAESFESNVTNKLISDEHSYTTGQILNRNNFHTLNLCFLNHWHRLLTGQEWDREETRRLNLDTQDLIALSSMRTQKQRRKSHDSDYYDFSNEKMADFRRVTEGILSEFDAGIVLLEFAKKHPELVVIPAPGMFEHGKVHDGKKRNVDFIIIDTAAKETTGAQVKGRLSNEKLDSYSLDHVFFIDGDTDMENITSRLVKGSAKTQTSTRHVSLVRAGAIAANHIAGWPTKLAELNKRRGIASIGPKERLIIQTYARTIETRRSLIGHYADIIGQRTLEHLYRSKPTPKEQG